MQVFELAPGGSGKVMWVVAIFLIVTMVGTLALLFSGARRPSFEVSPEGLRVRGNLYGRFIPASQLRIAEAQVVNLNATQDLRPKWITEAQTWPLATSMGGLILKLAPQGLDIAGRMKPAFDRAVGDGSGDRTATDRYEARVPAAPDRPERSR